MRRFSLPSRSQTQKDNPDTSEECVDPVLQRKQKAVPQVSKKNEALNT